MNIIERTHAAEFCEAKVESNLALYVRIIKTVLATSENPQAALRLLADDPCTARIVVGCVRLGLNFME
jgi:hypothetical protein